jgi:hypothetical protein
MTRDKRPELAILADRRLPIQHNLPGGTTRARPAQRKMFDADGVGMSGIKVL